MRHGNLARFLDLEPEPVEFRDAVLAGLARAPRSIPCRFLYDAQGSALFEQICALPEYYVTRTELAILGRHAPEMARLIGMKDLAPVEQAYVTNFKPVPTT